MRGRCERHQLALGPSGCLLCRREGPSVAEGAPQVPATAGADADASAATNTSTASQPNAVELSAPPRRLDVQLPPSLLLLPFVAAAFWYLATTEAAITPQASPASSLSAEPAGSPAADAPLRQTATKSPLPQPEPVPEQARAGPRLRDVDFPAQGASGSETAAPARLDASRAAEAAARREAEAQELAALRERVDVIVYFTEWCPACRELRSYLAERGIRSREYDVEHDRAASLRQRKLNPRGSIPTIDIEGQVLVGFNPQRIEAALDRAARARLQRQGY